MYSTWQLFVCTGFAAALAFGQQSQPASQTPEVSHKVLVERLRTISSQGGEQAIECGIAPRDKTEEAAGNCAQKAFQDRKPFFLGYQLLKGLGYGIAANGAGNVFEVSYQWRGYAPVALNRRMRLMDDNYTRVTECVKPVTFEKDPKGRLICGAPVNQEESEKAARQKPVDTTVCAVLENPAAFNNKLVRIRGHYSRSMETSTLRGDECSGALWFAYAGNGAAPGLMGMTSSPQPLGSEDPDGKLILPVPVKLVRDSKLEQFEATTGLGWGANIATATFVGRIDAVSNGVHEFLRQYPSDHGRTWWLGFGHMGQYEAELVLQSVEDVAPAPPSPGR